MLTCSLQEIYTRIPDIESGTPVFQVSNFINGIAAMPVRWTCGA